MENGNCPLTCGSASGIKEKISVF